MPDRKAKQVEPDSETVSTYLCLYHRAVSDREDFTSRTALEALGKARYLIIVGIDIISLNHHQRYTKLGE